MRFFHRSEPTENVVMCEWPSGCGREATTNAIDFDFHPAVVYRFCDRHSKKYRDEYESDAVFEPIDKGEVESY